MNSRVYSDLSVPQQAILSAVPFDRWASGQEIHAELAATDGITYSITQIKSTCHHLRKQGFVQSQEKKQGRGHTTRWKRVMVNSETRESSAAAADRDNRDMAKVTEDMVFAIEDAINLYTQGMDILIDASERLEALRAWPAKVVRAAETSKTSEQHELIGARKRIEELERKLATIKRQLDV